MAIFPVIQTKGVEMAKTRQQGLRRRSTGRRKAPQPPDRYFKIVVDVATKKYDDDSGQKIRDGQDMARRYGRDFFFDVGEVNKKWKERGCPA